MRLCMYQDENGRHLGAVQGDRVVDLAALSARDGGAALPGTLLGLIDLGSDGLRRVRELLDHAHTGGPGTVQGQPLDSIQLLAPLDPPRENVMAIGRNYQEHAEESARARGEQVAPPTVFTKAQTTINGPYGDVVIDQAITKEVDWEAELGVVIGQRGKGIAVDRALDYVFGYTVINDVSARDIQYDRGGQFFLGKSLDGFCPSGPWIVTADEIPDPQNLQIRLRVNGVTKQDANTRDMIYSVAALIAEVSRGTTLLPGNLIATGTPAGVSHGRQPPEWLQPGDVMETEIEGIGVLRNRIVGAG